MAAKAARRSFSEGGPLRTLNVLRLAGHVFPSNIDDTKSLAVCRSCGGRMVDGRDIGPAARLLRGFQTRSIVSGVARPVRRPSLIAREYIEPSCEPEAQRSRGTSAERLAAQEEHRQGPGRPPRSLLDDRLQAFAPGVERRPLLRVQIFDRVALFSVNPQLIPDAPRPCRD